MTDQHDVAILGGGPGGYIAALRAAQLGARVVLIEKDRVGGTCLNIGCIPTKALTTSTELLLKARRAAEFGISIPSAQPDLPRLMAYKQSTVDGLVSGVEQLLKESRVTLVRGEASLTRPDTLQVTGSDGSASEISVRHVVLAPGSITARPPIPGLDLPDVITSTEALDISEVPAHLIVVGGGVIGLEFACIYEAPGCRVTVLEIMPTLLPGGTDEALAKRLALILRRRGMDIHSGTTVQAIEPSEN
ncbi:MAG: Dihydrolipoyl dehydrogenase, partial [Anaerolineales bacterium]|nr:Dihydrolipoyl dehydrogenase [Anaerolineales bacterium]